MQDDSPLSIEKAMTDLAGRLVQFIGENCICESPLGFAWRSELVCNQIRPPVLVIHIMPAVVEDFESDFPDAEEVDDDIVYVGYCFNVEPLTIRIGSFADHLVFPFRGVHVSYHVQQSGTPVTTVYGTFENQPVAVHFHADPEDGQLPINVDAEDFDPHVMPSDDDDDDGPSEFPPVRPPDPDTKLSLNLGPFRFPKSKPKPDKPA